MNEYNAYIVKLLIYRPLVIEVNWLLTSSSPLDLSRNKHATPVYSFESSKEWKRGDDFFLEISFQVFKIFAQSRFNSFQFSKLYTDVSSV